MIPGLILAIIGGCLLQLMAKNGVPLSSARFKVSMQSVGFMVGFLLNASYGAWFMNAVSGVIWKEVCVGSIFYPIFVTFLISRKAGRQRAAAIMQARRSEHQENWIGNVSTLGLQLVA